MGFRVWETPQNPEFRPVLLIRILNPIQIRESEIAEGGSSFWHDVIERLNGFKAQSYLEGAQIWCRVQDLGS